VDQGPIANVIKDDASAAESNIFCFGAFADEQTGTLYNDLTSAFPFMSLAGNVCFLIVYHYETNAISALPIASIEGSTISEGYKKQFEFLEGKGHKIGLNLMDIPASCHIKNSHKKQMQSPPCQAPQPPCQRPRMRHPNLQGPLHQCPSSNEQ
jgi:hypothetical protein